MGVLDSIATVPQIFAGILTGFIAILGVRITYPIASVILGMAWQSTIMKVVATLIMWLIYFIVCWFFVWIKFLQPREKAAGG